MAERTEHSESDTEVAAAPANSGSQQGRREAIDRLLTLATAAPMVALLFDPRSARADGTGIGPEEP